MKKLLLKKRILLPATVFPFRSEKDPWFCCNPVPGKMFIQVVISKLLKNLKKHLLWFFLNDFWNYLLCKETGVQILSIPVNKLKDLQCCRPFFWTIDPESSYFALLKSDFPENWFLDLTILQKELYYLRYKKIIPTGAVPDSTGCAECRMHAEDDRLPR